MKQYPSIPAGAIAGVPVHVFPKYDGSNVRAEWTRKQGWRQFGSRRRVLAPGTLLGTRAKPLMLDTYGDDLARIFRAQRWDRVVAFFEFFGPRSFAGLHHEDDAQEVMLLDVAVHRRGLLPPDTVRALCAGLKLPPLLHHGPFTEAMAQQVRDGVFPGQTLEGIVAKGPLKTPGRPLSFKVKSAAWLAALRKKCASEEEFVRRR